ncbi:MAG TPA: hypothetical protein PLA74_07490, partial [Syntrophales bacterium]|nr:hypothetical protein [Syntrophales bacterium]
MEVLASFLIVIALLTTIHPLRESPEDELIMFVDVPGIQCVQKYEVKPSKQFSEENLVKQEYDYSCGSAALATILNYYLGEQFTEHQVIQGMMQYGDAEMIEQ